MRAPVSGGVGAVEMRLHIRVAPHRRGLGTALYQLLLAEILLHLGPRGALSQGSSGPVPGFLPVELWTVGPVKESAKRISLVSFVISAPRVGTELGAVPDLHEYAPWPLLVQLRWITRAKKFAGFSEYADSEFHAVPC